MHLALVAGSARLMQAGWSKGKPNALAGIGVASFHIT
jgi:hypothetical protein